MEASEWISIISLIFGAIVSPLLIWGAKRIYDSLNLKGTYINSMEATGSAPGAIIRYDGVFDGVDFRIVVRIINTTNKLQALEKITLVWKDVKSSYLSELKYLIDSKPRIKEYDLKDMSVDNFYKNITSNRDTVLPVLIEPNGGVIYLEIICNLGFYRNKNLKRQRFFPNIEKGYAQEVINNIERGKGIIKAKISGKVRNYPVVFWNVKDYN